MTENNLEVFEWRKIDHFCRICGKKIGVWSAKHSQLCQGCNLRERMRKQKEIESRVGA